MPLPNLPRQHKHKEADAGVDLKHYFERTTPNTCSIEVKHTRGKDYLLYSEVKDEQIAFALRVSSPKGAWIRTLGMNGEPDYIWLKNEIAFIVIKYPKGVVHITIGNFLFEKQKSKRKSLTWERASEICNKKIPTVK
jgi:hypothetical protein